MVWLWNSGSRQARNGLFPLHLLCRPILMFTKSRTALHDTLCILLSAGYVQLESNRTRCSWPAGLGVKFLRVSHLVFIFLEQFREEKENYCPVLQILSSSPLLATSSVLHRLTLKIKTWQNVVKKIVEKKKSTFLGRLRWSARTVSDSSCPIRNCTSTQKSLRQHGVIADVTLLSNIAAERHRGLHQFSKKRLPIK